MTKSHKHASDWPAWSKRRMIADLAEAGHTKESAFRTLRPMVESQTPPMIFRENVGGHRQPKPIALQLVELKNEIGRVYALARPRRILQVECPGNQAGAVRRS